MDAVFEVLVVNLDLFLTHGTQTFCIFRYHVLSFLAALVDNAKNMRPFGGVGCVEFVGSFVVALRDAQHFFFPQNPSALDHQVLFNLFFSRFPLFRGHVFKTVGVVKWICKADNSTLVGLVGPTFLALLRSVPR